MIREPDKTRDNVFPGRLKAVIIGPQVTVAFAGNADPALLAVQEARRELRRSGLSTAIDILKRESQDGQSGNGCPWGTTYDRQKRATPPCAVASSRSSDRGQLAGRLR